MRIRKITIIGLGLAAMLIVQGFGRGEDDGNDGVETDLSQATLDLNNGPVAGSNQPRPDEDWYLAELDLTLKWIPAGTFMMGSTPAEREWAAKLTGEGGFPRRVEIDQGFWMGQTTVTRGMFGRFVEEENYRTEAEREGRAYAYNPQTVNWGWQEGKGWRDPGFEQTDAHPVVCVTWNDAIAFCDWLTRVEREVGRLPEGYEYRLPGEAEWEYAARGGERERTIFWWGDSLADGRDRFNGAGTDRLPNGDRWAHGYDWEDGFAFTSPVDHYGARGRNGFGLADMLGNVWEWCLDGYDGNGAHTTIWQENTSSRALRGGSFNVPPRSQRSAGRGRISPATPSINYGFRVVLAPRVVLR